VALRIHVIAAFAVHAVRSIPDAMTACQEWANRRFEAIEKYLKFQGP